MDEVGMLPLIREGMRVLVIGTCESWNLQRGLWNIRLPTGEMIVMDSCNLQEYTDVREPSAAPDASAGARGPSPEPGAGPEHPAAPVPAVGPHQPIDAPDPRETRDATFPGREPEPEPAERQRHAPRDVVPRAPPENRVVLNVDNIGFRFARDAQNVHWWPEAFSWEGVRRAFQYYTARGVQVHGMVTQELLDIFELQRGDPLWRILTRVLDDDRFYGHGYLGCWMINVASNHRRCQAIESTPRAEWQLRANTLARLYGEHTSQEFMQRVAEHVVGFQFDVDGNFTPAVAPDVWP